MLPVEYEEGVFTMMDAEMIYDEIFNADIDYEPSIE